MMERSEILSGRSLTASSARDWSSSLDDADLLAIDRDENRTDQHDAFDDVLDK